VNNRLWEQSWPINVSDCAIFFVEPALSASTADDSARDPSSLAALGERESRDIPRSRMLFAIDRTNIFYTDLKKVRRD